MMPISISISISIVFDRAALQELETSAMMSAAQGSLGKSVWLAIAQIQQNQEDRVMPRKEILTEEEQVNLKKALEHIEQLEHLMKARPVETFKALIDLKIPMELEIEINGGSYAVKLNGSD